MHELLLQTPYPLPPQQHSQMLSILAGLCGMQPVPFLEKHLVFRPNRKPGEEKAVQLGGSQDVKADKRKDKKEGEGEVFYLRLVGARDDREGDTVNGRQQEQDTDHRKTSQENDIGNDTMELDGGGEDEGKLGREEKTSKVSWTLQFRDLPEVSRKEVTARLMVDTPIVKGNVVAFVEAMGYTFTTAFYMKGERFTNQSISLLLYRIFVPAPTDDDSELMRVPKAEKELGEKLDRSAGYMLQASVRVQDGSKVELINSAIKELNGLKETLKGVVELEAGERLAMDTRLR